MHVLSIKPEQWFDDLEAKDGVLVRASSWGRAAPGRRGPSLGYQDRSQRLALYTWSWGYQAS